MGERPIDGTGLDGAAQAAASLERASGSDALDSSAAVSAVDAAAEARLLSALFADPTLIDDVTDSLTPADFGVPVHEVVFAAMLACDGTGRAVDPVTVADELTRSGEIRRIGGTSALARIAEEPPVMAEFTAYVELIADRATRRRVLAASREIGAAALSGKLDSAELIGLAERSVFEATSTRGQSTMLSMTEVVAKMHERMAKARSAKLVGLSTGLETLDQVTGGFEPGQLVIIAGRPGSGKSVLLAQICQHIAETNGGAGVPLLSYEMQAHDIAMRLLANRSGVSLSELRRAQIPPEMDAIVAREVQKMAQMPLFIDDQPPPQFSGVRSAMRKMARRSEIKAIGIDYLQLMHAEQGVKEDNRAYVVGAISRGAKLLGDELGLPVLAASQLNRAVESRAGSGRPQLSDLRESGSLEQDAAIVILVHRPHLTNPEADPSEAELIVAKNRNGEAPFIIRARWEGGQMRFTDLGRLEFAPKPAPAAGGGQGGFGGGQGGFGGGGQGGFGGGFGGAPAGGFGGPRTVDPFDM